MVFGKAAPDDKIWYSISTGIYWCLCGSGVGRDVRLCLDYGIVFIVDFSNLSGIRSFGRVLLGFLRLGSGVGVVWG